MTEAEKEEILSKARNRLKYGCWCCEHLTQVEGMDACKYSQTFCRHDPEEVERNFDEWKLYKEYKKDTPFPNSKCKFVVEAKAVNN